MSSNKNSISVSAVAVNSTLPPQAGDESTAATPNTLESLAAPAVKSNSKVRQKVALTPGHSHLDWMRLSTSGRDLAGNNFRMRPITMAEVRQHRKLTDDGGVWMVVSGRVYNVTPYIEFHPGGAAELMKGAGKDATKLIQKIHAWVNVEAMLRSCLLGVLVTEDDDNNNDDK